MDNKVPELPVLKYDLSRESSVVTLRFSDYGMSAEMVMTQEECVHLGQKLIEIGAEQWDIPISRPQPILK